jgi:hypothetical protein
MAYVFSTKDGAAIWLYLNGWRQDDDGRWLKKTFDRKRPLHEALIKMSPAGDGGVSVKFVTVTERNNKD